MDMQTSNISDLLKYKEASKKKRLLNYVIDTLIYFLIAFGLLEILNLFTEIYISEELVLIFVSALYYILLEFFFGKTIGKFLTKSKVVDLFGENIDFRTSMVRYFCRWIPFETFSLALGSDAKAWHDLISKTLVIDDEIKAQF
ncbi:RDD family protein [Flagellimonas sp. GZD32]|uniref:RDD family protein n=1 Tax=Flagellimonas cixiensis TaxID=3228750 RepID=UPI0035C92FC7